MDWEKIYNAPKNRTLWVKTNSVEGLGEVHGWCKWHPDAGFCIDELREVTHWLPCASEGWNDPTIPRYWEGETSWE
jgi:hypothetical protein